MEETRIGPQSTIYHSIISRGTTTGNHFSTFAGNAIIPTESQIHHLYHIGAMIGEDCSFHNAITIDPGIIIGGECTISSMKHIKKDIPSNTNVM